MKLIKSYLLALLITAFPLLNTTCLSDQPSGNIQWYSYEEGIEKGRLENKNIYINFYADWCAYCIKMDESTFAESYVYAYLNKHFISIKVNVDKETRIAKEYKVQPIPDSWFLSKTGNKIANRPGYITPEQLIRMLKFIHTDSYKTMSFSTFQTRKDS